MNIFILDEDLQKSAEMLCDQHIVKMPTESVQMLSHALNYIGLIGPYKATKMHYNHPCTKWVRESLQNYQWLWNYTDAMSKEYSKRYNRQHLAHKKLLESVPYIIDLPDIGLTPFVNCTPYKSEKTVDVYRKFYIMEKSKFAIWKHSICPEWYLKGIKENGNEASHCIT